MINVRKVFKNVFTPQDIYRIMNSKAAYNFLDNREVDYVLVKLVEVVELRFNHLSVLLLLSCP
jgi:hypothetical protein